MSKPYTKLSAEPMRTNAEVEATFETLNALKWYANYRTRRADVEADGAIVAEEPAWAQHLVTAAEIESKYADELSDMGDWSEYALGVLDGRLLALNWLYGGDWDGQYINGNPLDNRRENLRKPELVPWEEYKRKMGRI